MNIATTANWIVFMFNSSEVWSFNASQSLTYLHKRGKCRLHVKEAQQDTWAQPLLKVYETLVLLVFKKKKSQNHIWCWLAISKLNFFSPLGFILPE